MESMYFLLKSGSIPACYVRKYQRVYSTFRPFDVSIEIRQVEVFFSEKDVWFWNHFFLDVFSWDGLQV